MAQPMEVVFTIRAGAGVSQPNASNPGTGPCLGCSVNGADRPGNGGLLPEAITEMTGETSAPSVALESPLPVLLLSHALAVE